MVVVLVLNKWSKLVIFVLWLLFASGCRQEAESLSELEVQEYKVLLGAKIFNDINLSSPAGQSCASCHDSNAGFADPDSDFPTSEGAISGRFGSRNTPAIGYSVFTPPFHFDQAEGLFIGGQFLDGRASDLKSQAAGPFTNPLEMNNRSNNEVTEKVRLSSYANLLVRVYGEQDFYDDEITFSNILDAIVAFESSELFNPLQFTSRFDRYLAGEQILTEQEIRGMGLFIAEDKGNCAACHPIEGSLLLPPLFTDFSYDNLGVPKNPDNLFYQQIVEFNPAGTDFIDLGLGAALNPASEENLGKFKVPTLRNIGLTAPYMHNGVFKTLQDVVSFYNSRDIDARWGEPEELRNMNTEELGNLGLTAQEEADIVAFLQTLNDGYGDD